jgi:molybdopterin/thiamine biosynthesis adenylyltransferase/rhodanese-related sulfurtransferase
MERKLRRLADLRERIAEIDPRDAFALAAEGAALVDVREHDEVAGGTPAGAIHLPRGFLELRVEAAIPDPARTVLLLCGGGARSLFAADGLAQLGYADVRSVRGGFSAWKQADLPIEVPKTLGDDGRERYGRHLLVPGVGEEGQVRLLESRVVLIGAGGLGSPAAFYLAAAGVGTLVIIDDDRVDKSNLQRQILHTDDRIGQPKVDSARRTLSALNPSIALETHDLRLDRHNVEELFAGADVVLDGTDNFATRYLVNDACVKLAIPNVHGSIYRFEGQVSVFWPGCPERRGPCYRCLFPEPPPPELAPSCAEAGVLGVLPGVVGTLQAVETIKILLGLGTPLVGRLLVYDALRASFIDLEQKADPDCAYCREGADFPGYVDYEGFCSTR